MNAKKTKPEAPKPDGSCWLTLRTAYTPEQIEARREDITTIEKRIADDRATLAKLKMQEGRKAWTERMRVRLDLDTMTVVDSDTGDQIHPSRLSSLQWKQAIEAAKAGK